MSEDQSILQYCLRVTLGLAAMCAACTVAVAFFAHTADGLWSLLIFLICPWPSKNKDSDGVST